MENNTTAALILSRNLWPIKFGRSCAKGKWSHVMFDRIPFEVVNETLETFARAESAV